MQKPIPEECVGFPDAAVMSTVNGLAENHDYRDLRGFTEDDYTWCLGDEASYELGGNCVYSWGLDPGVASTVVALSIIGACPVTCCSGEAGHYEAHPLVLCWCSQEQLEMILRAAESAEVEVEGVCHPGILIYTQNDLRDMREFSRKLLDIHRGGVVMEPKRVVGGEHQGIGKHDVPVPYPGSCP